ncbi:DUF3237 family protein [Microbacterium sp. W4I20]|uniref:DUF3237 family protein n=1 Tax=Microbacterium sp. W4I20 TaxID=3042262 RepID=UPI002785E4EF|nr:DUF3237 family protein [Microbacterium sp. W4I20]MDQ0728827.1 hypothetical protein [Microbacterium sp. W4I20]
MNPSVAPHLRFVFRIVAEVGSYLPLQKRDAELLEFIPIVGGTVDGEVSGTVVAGGGDWCVTRADDAYDVEARYLIRTDGDQIVDVVNVGVVRHLPGGTGEAMGYFQSTPRFRTTAPDLQWLTRSVFVGRGVTNPDNATIDIFEVQA